RPSGPQPERTLFVAPDAPFAVEANFTILVIRELHERRILRQLTRRVLAGGEAPRLFDDRFMTELVFAGGCRVGSPLTVRRAGETHERQGDQRQPGLDVTHVHLPRMTSQLVLARTAVSQRERIPL